jgi:hypothetical protein
MRVSTGGYGYDGNNSDGDGSDADGSDDDGSDGNGSDGDGSDSDSSVQERGKKVRLISPLPSQSNSSSYLCFATFLVLLASGGVGVGVDCAVAG